MGENEIVINGSVSSQEILEELLQRSEKGEDKIFKLAKKLDNLKKEGRLNKEIL